MVRCFSARFLCVFLFLLITLIGCASPSSYLIPTPALYSDDRLDLMPAFVASQRLVEIPLFYVTTRTPVVTDATVHYGNRPAESPRHGVARVKLGPSDWDFDDLAASDRQANLEMPRPGRVLAVEEFGAESNQDLSVAEAQWIEAINAQIDRVPNKELVFYVHGYRVSFDEVAVMMASWSHYLGHNALVAYQWPTGQQFWNYFTDCPRARQYVPDIRRTLALLARTRASRINLIAYSCGSPLLAEALGGLRSQYADEDPVQLQQRFRFGTILFAASDVDLKTFAETYVNPILELSQQTQIYISRNDRALFWASLVSGMSRLGNPDIDDLDPATLARLASDPRLVVIDVSNVRGAHETDGMRGHGYWYANDWISSDVLLSLRFSIPPERRCLTGSGATAVWTLRDDYIDCLVDAVLKKYPDLATGAHL